MFSGFWQLVVDQNVSLIVMITKLVENQKRKAHQYWPEEVGQEIQMEHGIVVQYEQEEVLDGIFKRQFTVAVKGNNLDHYYKGWTKINIEKNVDHLF